mmetsp:Transcript_7562/g.5458  ORF Transcript_7562/g.5458 Transcript_7562/m.5458 type:complete len:221 (-) Transcript_7562:141-803(-)
MLLLSLSTHVLAACDAGYLAKTDANGIAYCEICPAGSTCPDENTETTCTAPDYALAGSSSASCLTCPSGHKCPNNNVPPIMCAIGEIPSSDKLSCDSCTTATEACPAPTGTGTACTTGVLWQGVLCNSCPAGEECSSGTSTACTSPDSSAHADSSCDTPTAGQFGPVDLDPTNCPTNTYSYTSGSNVCNVCDAGVDCSASASSSTACTGTKSSALGDPGC